RVEWIEDRDRRECPRRKTGIDGCDPVLIVAAEQVDTRDAPPCERQLRGDIEFIGIRPAEARRYRGVRSTEVQYQRALELIDAPAETVRVSKIEIAARQRPIEPRVYAPNHKAM